MHPIQFTQLPRISLDKVSGPGAALAQPERGLQFPLKYSCRVMPYIWLLLFPSVDKGSGFSHRVSQSRWSSLNTQGGDSEMGIKVALDSPWAGFSFLVYSAKVEYYLASALLCLFFTGVLPCPSKPPFFFVTTYPEFYFRFMEMHECHGSLKSILLI